MTPYWPERFLDATVVVTGGARGIGRAAAERFALEGASVTALDLDDHPPSDWNREIRLVACDIRDEASVDRAFSDVLDRRPAIDVLVNNAGINAYFDATTMTLADWDAVMNVDLRGAWLCARACIPHMTTPGGAIVNVASVHAMATFPGMFPYAAAKSGLLGLTRSLALDYGPAGLRVTAVCPGWVRTALVDEWLERQDDPAGALAAVEAVQPLRRISTPDEIAAGIAFLASAEASFVTGSALVIDGGLTARAAG
jgi:NAD(P)-dependent dehydrogenase (short-subunit alcohol dehydrogenase family)